MDDPFHEMYVYTYVFGGFQLVQMSYHIDHIYIFSDLHELIQYAFGGFQLVQMFCHILNICAVSSLHELFQYVFGGY